MGISKKRLIGDAAINIAAMWLAGWLSKWIAMIPGYIYRGSFPAQDAATRGTAETLIMGIGGVLIAALLLTIYHRATDRAERLTLQNAWQEAALSAAVYALLQFLFGALLWNNQMIAHCAYWLSMLFGTRMDPLYSVERPTVLGFLLSALISCTLYMLATVWGMRLAAKRRQRAVEEMKKESR